MLGVSFDDLEKKATELFTEVELIRKGKMEERLSTKKKNKQGVEWSKELRRLQSSINCAV